MRPHALCVAALLGLALCAHASECAGALERPRGAACARRRLPPLVVAAGSRLASRSRRQAAAPTHPLPPPWLPRP